MGHSNRIFKPNFRVIVDTLLIFNVILFIMYALLKIDFWVLLVGGIIINGLFIISWFIFVVPVVSIEVSQSDIIGPSPLFKRVSIPIRKVDHNRLYSVGNPRKSFAKDLWTVDGQRVRLYRKFLGEGKVGTIISIIEKYPFREKNTV